MLLPLSIHEKQIEQKIAPKMEGREQKSRMSAEWKSRK